MISVGRDGLLVKLAPIIASDLLAWLPETTELSARSFLGHELQIGDAARDMPFWSLIGRAVGARTAEVADAMLREWREWDDRKDMSERHARRSA